MGQLDDKENQQTGDDALKKNSDAEPKETEKLLDNRNSANKVLPEKENTNQTLKSSMGNGEEVIVNVPEIILPSLQQQQMETAALTEEGREVKPKKIPIGGIKMPGFFTKNKPRSEGDGADGELLQSPNNDTKVDGQSPLHQQIQQPTKEPGKGFFSAFRLQLFKSNKKQQLKNEQEEFDEVKTDEIKPDESIGYESTDHTQPPVAKKGLLNAIRLPITNIIPRKLKPVNGENPADDVEMGNGPNNKAGLASMETLDDSLKDTENGKDVTDRSTQQHTGQPITSGETPESSEGGKLNHSKEITNEKEKLNETIMVDKQTCLERLRAYKCSMDDITIIVGVLVFLLLFAIILACVFTTGGEMTTTRLRDGKYINVVTSCGLVEGMLEDSAFAFRGIPYALPPIGEMRWRPAQLVENIDDCWNGTYKAHNATPPCLQIYGNGTVYGDENCLQLDVITPEIRYINPLPVVVLIGAETLVGDSPTKLKPSVRYSRARDVLFVRPNFRMGIFGFLALDALSKSTYPPTSGNYALSDLLAVLRWIQLNIEHFGGDPSAVTLVGHRAGATLVTLLSSSTEAKGLFSRVWVTSGAAIFPGRPLVESERYNQEFLNQLGCQSSKCLREANSEALLEAVPDQWRRTWPDLPEHKENTSRRHEWLVLDGKIIHNHPAALWANSGEIGAPKIVIGTTAHEAHSEKLYFKHKEWTAELVRKHVEESKIGELGLTDEALKRYNATYQGLVSMISDIRTICPLLTMARQQPSAPFYVVTQIGGELGIADVDADIQAILGRYEGKTPEQRRYISAIQQLFYHYVSHGQMKQFELRRRILNIGQDALPEEDYRNCDFWISKDVVPRYARLD